MTTTNTLSPTILPGFQKRSGTKIIEALRAGGWTIDGFVVQYGDRHIVKAHHPFDNGDVVNRATITVSENGALVWAEMKVNDLRGGGTNSVSEACFSLGAPNRVIADNDRKAQQQAREEARTLAAQVARGQYRNGPLWDRHAWTRERLTKMAEVPGDITIKTNQYSGFILSAAEGLLKALFVHSLAYEALALEGTPKDWDDTGTKVISVYDLKEAVKEVLYRSCGSSDARNTSTAHAYAEAQSEMYYAVR